MEYKGNAQLKNMVPYIIILGPMEYHAGIKKNELEPVDFEGSIFLPDIY